VKVEQLRHHQDLIHYLVPGSTPHASLHVILDLIIPISFEMYLIWYEIDLISDLYNKIFNDTRGYMGVASYDQRADASSSTGSCTALQQKKKAWPGWACRSWQPWPHLGYQYRAHTRLSRRAPADRAKNKLKKLLRGGKKLTITK
jgi:hypothetical protein